MSSDEVPQMQTAPYFSSSQQAGTMSFQTDAGVEDCVDSAYICCQKAQEAARYGRMQAAHGLVQTAVSLYQRAERESSGDAAFSSRLDCLVSELCICAQVIEVEAVARLTAPKENKK
jgi:hypothetical protein